MTIRILLFDDDPVVRITLERWMASQGDMQVVGSAGDGEEAIGIATQTPADVIVMDIKMPGLSGLEATRVLRSRGITTPVLILTADETAERAVTSLPGAAFLWKGNIAPRAALKAIRSAAEGSRSPRGR